MIVYLICGKPNNTGDAKTPKQARMNKKNKICVFICNMYGRITFIDC
jgi:hypothetical protein